MDKKMLIGFWAAFGVFSIACTPALNFSQHTSGDSWTPLFDRESGGWAEAGSGTWTFENGTLTGQSGDEPGYVVTENSFGNFHLKLDFFPDETVNSGIFLRCSDEIGAVTCYEINIWDNHTNQDYRTGAIVTHGRPKAHVNTTGQWNDYEIIVNGGNLQVWVNGIKTADLTDDQHISGTIALQTAGEGTIKFRNVRILEL